MDRPLSSTTSRSHSTFDTLVQSDLPILEFALKMPSANTMKMGEFIASLIDDGSTIQTGIGEIPSPVMSCLAGKKDLGISPWVNVLVHSTPSPSAYLACSAV